MVEEAKVWIDWFVLKDKGNFIINVFDLPFLLLFFLFLLVFCSIILSFFSINLLVVVLTFE